ncbi:MAG: succinylglutamate desuccinylase/aspartoacylase family protein [Gemmatimonadota bacterium]|nr:succinylglutamate desuccinylase/aspartoacylase family protein [Gemmatimonadota bacterium]
MATIHGAKSGRTVAVLSGAHGTEYASILAAQAVIPRIDAAKLSGTVIVVPLINRASFERMRVHMNPVDEKSMNGNYPGKATGTQTERVLDVIARDVIAKADVVIDLHNGDIDENLRPYSYWTRTGNAAQDSVALELCRAMGLDHIIVRNLDVKNPASTRSASGYALSLGKVAIVAAAGRWARTDVSDIRLLEDGILGVLGQLGMLQRAKPAPLRVTWLGDDARVRADSNVFWSAVVDRGARVKAGQAIGFTSDYWGRKIADVRAPKDGMVTFIRSVPSAWAGATLVTVAELLVRPEPWKKP